MTEDFMNTDSLSVAVKTGIADDMKKWYLAFGWTLTREFPDKHGTTHLDFTRPHKIENKDRLQLLQVRFEMLANATARARRKITSGKGALYIILFIVGAALLACGISLLVMANTTLYIVSGSVILFSGVLFWGVSTILCLQMRKSDIKKSDAFIKVLLENIRAVVEEAAEITGFEYGNTK